MVGNISVPMKNYVLTIIMLIGVTSCYAQANRYDRAVPIEYQSIYQDMDLYINMAKMSREMKEARKRTQELIEQVETIYKSYPQYPNTINDGWHEVVLINTSPKRIYSTKAYTINNYVVKVYKKNKLIDLPKKPSIIRGKSYSSDFTLFFLEDLEAYNMNYKK